MELLKRNQVELEENLDGLGGLCERSYKKSIWIFEGN
jgi:hypothetical protein